MQDSNIIIVWMLAATIKGRGGCGTGNAWQLLLIRNLHVCGTSQLIEYIPYAHPWPAMGTLSCEHAQNVGTYTLYIAWLIGVASDKAACVASVALVKCLETKKSEGNDNDNQFTCTCVYLCTQGNNPLLCMTLYILCTLTPCTTTLTCTPFFWLQMI